MAAAAAAHYQLVKMYRHVSCVLFVGCLITESDMMPALLPTLWPSQVTARELQQPFLQADNVEAVAPGRATFTSSTPAAGYAAALCLRSATRVLEVLHEEHLNPNRPAGETVRVSVCQAACPSLTNCVQCSRHSNVTG